MYMPTCTSSIPIIHPWFMMLLLLDRAKKQSINGFFSLLDAFRRGTDAINYLFVGIQS